MSSQGRHQVARSEGRDAVDGYARSAHGDQRRGRRATRDGSSQAGEAGQVGCAEGLVVPPDRADRQDSACGARVGDDEVDIGCRGSPPEAADRVDGDEPADCGSDEG
jgi:hypothetical protein